MRKFTSFKKMVVMWMALSASSFIMAQTPDANGIVYVRETIVGNGSGDSWADATNNLQGAINAVGAQMVFVASGTYTVGSSSFVMKNDVAVYGGFDPDNGINDLADNRIMPDSSNLQGSVLSGNNERPPVWNEYTSVNPLFSSALLDGFMLTDGTITGLYNRCASPTLKNLVIKGNVASPYGGGMYNRENSAPELTNVIIVENIANYGAGMFNEESSPILNNVIIARNTANNNGGGLYNDNNSSPEMTNVSIIGNTAQNGAGMYNRTNSSPVITNALIANNTALNNGGAIRNEATSSPQLINVTIANNSGSNAIYATDGSTTFSNSVVFGAVSADYTVQYSLVEGNTDTDNGNLDATGIIETAVFNDYNNNDYTLTLTSIATNAGNNAFNSTSTDLAGNTRIIGTAIDLGAYEMQCAAINTTDTRSECAPFTWIDGNSYTADNSTETYTLQSVVTGCDSVVTLNLTITDIIPAVALIGTTLTAAQTGADYQWIDCDNGNAPISGATGQSFTATANGNYAVEITVNNCTETSACMAVGSVGISVIEQNSWKIYPNPVNDKLFIESDEALEIEITDALGNVLVFAKFSNKQNVIDVSNFASGVYFIKSFKSTSNGVSNKFVKY